MCLGEEALEGAAGGLGGSGGDGERGGVQDLPQAFGVQSPDAVLFEEFGEGGDAQLEGECGGFGLVPELAEPGVGELIEEVGDREQLGVVAPELLADLVAEPGALAGEFVDGPGAFAQLEDERLLEFDPSEEVGVGAEGRERASRHRGGRPSPRRRRSGAGSRGSGRGPMANTRKAGDQQALDDRPVGRLDGDRELPGGGPGLVQEPADELRLARAAVGKGPAAANRTVRLQQAYMVGRRAPIDTDEKQKRRCHGAVVLPREAPQGEVSRRDVRWGLYWLLDGAALLRCVPSRPRSVEAQSGVGVRNTCLRLVAPGGSANRLVK